MNFHLLTCSRARPAREHFRSYLAMNIKFTIISIGLCITTVLPVGGQQYDRYWISGYSTSLSPPFLGNILDFSSDPPAIDTAAVGMQVWDCNGTMSDFNGYLLFYCNGGQVRNNNFDLLENGDSLNFGYLFEKPQHGLPQANTLIILPSTHTSFLYHILHVYVDTCATTLGLVCAEELRHTLVDMSANGGGGKVVFKNRPILSAEAMEYPAAVRHGNGRDWWLLTPNYREASFHTLLFNDGGVQDSFLQVVGYKPDPVEFRDRGGANLFSPDGKRYVDFDSRNGLRLFDFDRCSGRLSNFQWIQLPEQLPVGSQAVFSPNSRFLYVTARDTIYQYDLEAPDIAAGRDTVAVWDGFYSPAPPFATNFGLAQIALNGKIYIAPNNGVYHLHYINYPDLKGDSCQVVQHGLELPNVFALAVPVLPNYRLYDLPGSPCDTLGIDGPPTVSQRPAPDAPVLRLYPNPASGWLVLESALAPAQPLRLRFYDARGRLALERAHPDYTRSYGFDISALPAGYYVVEIECAGGRRYVEKVVVGR